jgi:DNA polymerase III sliding clamp (beta) subunit (PCNA family)
MQSGWREDSPAAALVDLEVEFPRSQETEIIVPAKAVTEIQRLVHQEGEVNLSICQNQIAFELNRTLLVYMNSGGTIEIAQRIAGHTSPSTTRIYDRSGTS